MKVHAGQNNSIFNDRVPSLYRWSPMGIVDYPLRQGATIDKILFSGSIIYSESDEIVMSNVPRIDAKSYCSSACSFSTYSNSSAAHFMRHVSLLDPAQFCARYVLYGGSSAASIMSSPHSLEVILRCSSILSNTE